MANKDRFKFRVWDKYKRTTPAENMAFICFSGCLVDSDGCHYDPSDYVVEQCTGLKDKNGNLIYEGDIIKCGNATGIVCFGFYRRADEHFPDSIYGYYIEWKQSYFRQDFGYWATEERIEIIGNIHEQAEQKDI